jgi:hypothetical protein
MPLQWRGPSWPWSYGSWTYNYLCNQCLSPLMLWVRILIRDYLCNQCLSPLMLWVRILIRARCTTLCDKVCQWLATCWWFSSDTRVSSINKADHNITEILLKVALNTIKQTLQWRGHHGHDHMVSCTNKADCDYRTEILLKVALNTINPPFQWKLSKPNFLGTHFSVRFIQVWFKTYSDNFLFIYIMLISKHI